MNTLSRFGIDLKKETPESVAVYSLACTYATIEKSISDHLKQFNLTISQFNALMIIKHTGQEKGISQIEIGERLIVSASNMTRLIDKLTKAELLERIPSETDRRVNLIRITKKGATLLDLIWPDYFSKINQLGKHLETNELKTLSKLLIKWFENLKEK